MSSHKTRIRRLEDRAGPADRPQLISDAARMEAMRRLSFEIAGQARELGITAQDDPRLGLPLTIAGILEG